MRSDEGIIYFQQSRSVDYGPDYFFKEYQTQYGLNYLQDEARIRALARSRLKAIQKFVKPEANLFEIGCATGFFLDEARNKGFQVAGLDISHTSIEYARTTFQLDVEVTAFPGPGKETEPEDQSDTQYDVVAAFYALEHIPEQKQAFRSIASMLKPGGIFAFAMPSTYGPHFEYNLQAWKETHPVDHFADYSPSSLAKIFPLYDLELVHTRPASYHPERLPPSLLQNFPLFYKWWAYRRGYGDTIEGIARKK